MKKRQNKYEILLGMSEEQLKSISMEKNGYGCATCEALMAQQILYQRVNCMVETSIYFNIADWKAAKNRYKDSDYDYNGVDRAELYDKGLSI